MSELTSFAADRPLLMATDYAPGVGGGGAVILRSLLRPEDRSRIVWASPSTKGGDEESPGSAGLSRGSHRFSRWLKRRSLTVDSLSAGQLAEEILDLARRRGAPALWIVMHGSMVHVAARLLARTDLPTHLTVHDDPPFGVALMSKRYLALIPLIARDLGYALRRARSIDVISDGMADRYRKLYGVDPVVVHRGTAAQVGSSPDHGAPAELELGVLGNTYGYDQLLLLAGAVAQAAAAAGVPGKLVVVGQGHGARLREAVAGRVEVEVTGHLDESAAIDRLRRCFMLYLNYPFSMRASVLRQTSFPTKLSTYLFAARPLLAHAPRKSSLAPLAAWENYVTWWDDEQVDRGAALILEAWKTARLHTSQHVAAEEVRRRFYDLEENRSLLFGALNRLIVAGP